MTETQESKCPACGSGMVANDGRRFCPACLLQQGMRPSTFAGNSVFQNWSPPKIEYLVDKFPQLQIESLLGQGGMGAVYKVQQKELDRPAALKVLPDVAAHDPGFTERFLREARLLASLSHPHIVTVYEFGQRDGVYFLLMEYIDGVTLRQASMADPIKRLSSKEALAVVGQLCDALQFAHDEGVVHRDIKPENILIDRRGRVKIADFGLAKLLGQQADLPTLTKTHQLMGTPAYMAPEQIEGQPVIDHRADIYSLGVVFYELLTGELPLGRFQPPSQKADLDARLDEVVLRTLEKEPDRRFQQASHVRTEMDAIRSPAVSTVTGRKRWTVARPLLYVLTGVVLTLVSTRIALDPGGILRMEVPGRAETRIQTSDGPIQITMQDSMQTEIPGDSVQFNLDGHAEFSRNGGAGFGSNYEEEMYDSDAYGGQMQSGGVGAFSGGAGMEAGGIGGFEAMTSGTLQQQGPVLEFAEHRVTLRADVGTFTVDEREKVNQILSGVHQQYLKLEADHSIISVLDDGSVQTTVYCFPGKLERLDDELWTQLDDCLNVDQQRALRKSLPVTGTPLRSHGAAGFGGGMMGGGEDDYESAGIVETSSAELVPGLLGWSQSAASMQAENQILRTVRIIRKGRWFQCCVGDGKRLKTSPSAPNIPPEFARFEQEAGPHLTVANANAAFRLEKWDALLDCFTTRCAIRWAAESQARLQIAAQTNPTIDGGRSTSEIQALMERKSTAALPATEHSLEELSGMNEDQMNRYRLVSDYGLQTSEETQTKILEQLEALATHQKLKFLYETFSLYSILNAIQFPISGVEVSQIDRDQNTASAVIEYPNGGQSMVQLVLMDGQWKIDQMDIDWESLGLPQNVNAESVRVERINQQLRRLNEQLRQMERNFGPQHSEILNLKAEIDQVRSQLQANPDTELIPVNDSELETAPESTNAKSLSDVPESSDGT